MDSKPTLDDYDEMTPDYYIDTTPEEHLYNWGYPAFKHNNVSTSALFWLATYGVETLVIDRSGTAYMLPSEFRVYPGSDFSFVYDVCICGNRSEVPA